MLLPSVTLQKGSTCFWRHGKERMIEFRQGKPVHVPVDLATVIMGDNRFKVLGIERVESFVQNVKVKAFQMRLDLCH